MLKKWIKQEFSNFCYMMAFKGYRFNTDVWDWKKVHCYINFTLPRYCFLGDLVPIFYFITLPLIPPKLLNILQYTSLILIEPTMRSKLFDIVTRNLELLVTSHFHHSFDSSCLSNWNFFRQADFNLKWILKWFFV